MKWSVVMYSFYDKDVRHLEHHAITSEQTSNTYFRPKFNAIVKIISSIHLRMIFNLAKHLSLFVRDISCMLVWQKKIGIGLSK